MKKISFIVASGILFSAALFFGNGMTGEKVSSIMFNTATHQSTEYCDFPCGHITINGVPVATVSQYYTSLAQFASYVQTTTQVNTHALSSNVTLYSGDIPESTNYRFLNDAQKVLATQYASTSQSGLTSYSDWNIFNNKQSALASPLQFAKFRVALASVRAGISDAKIICLGDSTTAGYGSYSQNTTPAYGSWPYLLASLMNSAGIPAAPGLAIPPSAGGDNRWTLGSGWSKQNFGFADVTCYSGSSPSGNLIFTPGGSYTYDSFDVYYLQASGLGTMTVVATGGTPSIINCSGTNSVKKTTVSASLLASSNAITVSSSGAIYIVGVEPFASSIKRIRIGNAGAPSTTSAQFAQTYTFMNSDMLTAYQPNLTIISFGINDAGLQQYSANQFNGFMQTIINYSITAGGNTVLMTFPPSASSTVNATYEPGYIPVYNNLGIVNGLTIVDIYTRFGGIPSRNASFMFDTLHPNDAGYWDIASAVMSMFKQIQ